MIQNYYFVNGWKSENFMEVKLKLQSSGLSSSAVSFGWSLMFERDITPPPSR
jgi:hypothetical protein